MPLKTLIKVFTRLYTKKSRVSAPHVHLTTLQFHVLLVSQVSIGVRVQSIKVHNTFVVDQFVTFVLSFGQKNFTDTVPYDLVRVMGEESTWCLLRIREFRRHQGFHGVKIDDLGGAKAFVEPSGFAGDIP